MSMPEQSGDSFDFCVLFRVYFTGKGATATEVISQDSKTARTIKCNKNMLTEMLEDVIHAIVALGVWLHQLPRRA